jgi:hypothetical protein
MENKKEFVDGLFVNQPREGAPEFVKGSLSITVEKFITYLQAKANAKGYVNIDLLESKEGKLYAKLNDWKPQSGEMKENESINIPEEDEEEITAQNIKIPF